MILPAVAVLGTMHGKAAGIAPPLAEIGISVVVPPDFDTDRFGTFTGKVSRTGTMLEAARAKARAAIAATGIPVGLASEGAYGPHPSIPFMMAGREMLLWRNEQTGHEVVETLLDGSPCFAHVDVLHAGELAAFLRDIDFPRTAVVVTPRGMPARPVAKGLSDAGNLSRAVAIAAEQSSDGMATVATDMRAHVNARRMATIARLARQMAIRLSTPCPSCGVEGFGVVRRDRGLPCGACGTATPLFQSSLRQCAACGFELNLPVVNALAQPAECPACNP